MKRLLMILVLVCTTVGAMAQTDDMDMTTRRSRRAATEEVSDTVKSLVCFELQPDGTFKMPNGDDFVIMHFNGKSATELYQMFYGAVNKGFQTEHRITRQIENTSLTVEGITDTLSLRGAGTVVVKHSFQIMFHFKDGRVKIDAPVLTKAYASMKIMGRSDHFYEQDSSFKEWTQNGSVFLKFRDGIPSKEKYMRNWRVINSKTNELINCVLRQLDKASEDW